MNEKVSVIIPAKDEASSIANLVARIKASLAGHEFEVIVVDDGSKDNTDDIARNSGAKSISHTRNLGKGAAMKTGASAATGDMLVFLDGDGAHYPEDIPAMIVPIIQNSADLIVGSRNFSHSNYFGSYWSRRLTNNLSSFTTSIIVSFLLPLFTLLKCPMKWIRIPDAQNGFKAISREKWGKLSLVSQGFEIETEIIYEAAKRSFTIQNVPVSCNWDCKVSRLSIVRDGLKTVKLLTRKLVQDAGGR